MSINQTLSDIGRGLIPQTLPQPSPVEAGEYGDFELGKTDGGRATFNPVSDAAIRWVVEHVPEWVDRHGTRAFTLPRDEMDAVIAAAERDGLLSLDDYQAAMEEMDAISRQWEDQ